MIVWLTGAKGFIGQYLARHHASKGHLVLGVGHGDWPNATSEAGLTYWVNGEISAVNLSLMQDACGKPDLVVHLAGGGSVGAAVAHPSEDFNRTVNSTLALLEWLRLNSPHTKLVGVSSAAVNGVCHSGRLDESAPTNPVSPYGYHKLMMEQLCQSYAGSYGLQCVVLRLFSVYGPGLRKQLLWDLCNRLQASPAVIELSGTGNELRDWTHISDVVNAVELTASLASTEVPTFAVGSGCATSVRDIAQSVISVFAAKGGQTMLRFNGNVRPGDPFSLVANPTRLEALGFACGITPLIGVPDYVRWFLSLADSRSM
jgi:UDP-glucose 4-epimerase